MNREFSFFLIKVCFVCY